MHRGLAVAVVAAMLGAGCADPDAGGLENRDDGTPVTNDVVVPPLRVGDTFRYHIGFSSGDFTFDDETHLRVAELAKRRDASGVERDAFLLRQGYVADAFWEDYWVDARTYRQFQLVRSDNYTDVSRLASPVPMIPSKATWANGTGPLERNLEDPVFEDANFFGIFATDRILVAGEPFNVTGNLWERGSTDLLARGNWSGTPEASLDETWGELRTLSLEAKWSGGQDFETIAWSGAFSGSAPLAVEATRDLKAKFGTREIDVRLNATLLEFKPGDGKEIRRTDEPKERPLGKVPRAAAEMFPAGANDARLGFRFQEAFDALKLDPTASQFFAAHAGSYVRYAHSFEVDTCEFFPNQGYPGCHWAAWFGIFSAPDDFQMSFVVEKYHGGAVSVSFTPVIPTEEIVDILFEATAGEVPSGPPAFAVVVSKSTQDLPPRSAFPGDAVTFAGALDAFMAGAKSQNVNRAPNMAAFYLTPEGYGFYLANYQFLFPPDPELFILYDDMPMELERRALDVDPAGRVLHNQNYDLQIAHK